MARISLSQAIPLVGLQWDDMNRFVYLEATTGVQYKVLDNLHLGAGIYGMFVDGTPHLGGSVSASGTFTQRKR